MIKSMAVQIKEKMLQKGFNAYALERQAGLKPSAVHNIIYGRSKNPSIHTLLAVSKALDCTVSDLIGENQMFLDNSEEVLVTNNLPEPFNAELYTKCLASLSALLVKEKTWVNREHLLSCADEIYSYSLKKGVMNKVDLYFVKWLIAKSLKS